MVEISKFEPASQMAKSLLEQYDYDVKKCKEYITIKYLESENNPVRNQYWLNVGLNVEEQCTIKKPTS